MPPDAGRPVSAYEIIDSLRDKAILAPQTVYRSLDRLIASGAAHRLESLNAFVACSHAVHKGSASSPSATAAAASTNSMNPRPSRHSPIGLTPPTSPCAR